MVNDKIAPAILKSTKDPVPNVRFVGFENLEGVDSVESFFSEFSSEAVRKKICEVRC